MKHVLFLFLILLGVMTFAQEGTLRIPLVGDVFISDMYTWECLKLGKDNNIYIADRQKYQIKIFNSKGKYLSAFGRRGEGPGEFKRWFGEYNINKDGKIYQADFMGGNRSISFFTPTGKFIDRVKLQIKQNFGVTGINFLKNGNFLLHLSMGTDVVQKGGLFFMGSGEHFCEVNQQGEIVKTFFKKFSYHSFSTGMDKGWPNIPYRIDLISTFDQQNQVIAWQKTHEDQIHFYDIKSKKEFTYSNGFKKISVSEADINEWYEKYVKNNRRRRMHVPYYKKLLAYGKTVEEYQPIISGMIFDPQGNLHLFSKKKDEQYSVSLFDLQRGLIKQAKQKYTPSLITLDRIYYFEFDEEEDCYNLVIKNR